MTLREFVRQNRTELTRIINRAIGNEENTSMNDHERELWVTNDECLYNWAKSEGVRLS